MTKHLATYEDAIDRLNQYVNCLYDRRVGLGNYVLAAEAYETGVSDDEPIDDGDPLMCSPYFFYFEADGLTCDIQCLISAFSAMFDTTRDAIIADMENYDLVRETERMLMDVRIVINDYCEEGIERMVDDGRFNQFIIRP